VLCLQEVDGKLFYNDLMPLLAHMGFEARCGASSPKPRGMINIDIEHDAHTELHFSSGSLIINRKPQTIKPGTMRRALLPEKLARQHGDQLWLGGAQNSPSTRHSWCSTDLG